MNLNCALPNPALQLTVNLPASLRSRRMTAAERKAARQLG
jgi:hypothetical protein